MTRPTDPTSTPAIACSLGAADYENRLADMGALGTDALIEADVQSTRAVLRFTDDDGIRTRVEAIVEAEKQCCPFLALDVTIEPGAVALTIEAPLDAEAVLSELVDAFCRTAAL